MLASRLLLLLLPSAAALSARAWLGGSARLELGLLPFPLEQALLPGETKQVHLYEARFIQLFEDCTLSHSDCLGALLITPGGGISAVTTLLQVEEFRKQEFGVWARLKVHSTVDSRAPRPMPSPHRARTIGCIVITKGAHEKPHACREGRIDDDRMDRWMEKKE